LGVCSYAPRDGAPGGVRRQSHPPPPRRNVGLQRWCHKPNSSYPISIAFNSAHISTFRARSPYKGARAVGVAQSGGGSGPLHATEQRQRQLNDLFNARDHAHIGWPKKTRPLRLTADNFKTPEPNCSIFAHFNTVLNF